MAEHTPEETEKVVSSINARPDSRMIGPGVQILSVKATDELMRLIQDRKSNVIAIVKVEGRMAP